MEADVAGSLKEVDQKFKEQCVLARWLVDRTVKNFLLARVADARVACWCDARIEWEDASVGQQSTLQ